jgi:UDP-glucose 4-epimerase
MYKILITGGAGYIGSHMICSLFDAQKKYQVVAFDNLSRGFRDACGDATFIQGDLRSLADIHRCFDYFKPDLVMHFAGLSYVGESMIKPADYYENNVTGSLNLLKVMLERDVKNFVFSSL